MTIEFATVGFATPGVAVPAAETAERDGFDILLLTDSQCLRGDVYTQMVLCGKATDKLRLGTGVSNPITRHASVTAASIAGVHVETDGRAILGIGRGDSSVLHIGRQPATMRKYGDYVREVQAYLAGDEVDQNGFPSRLRWLDQFDVPKVPVDMTGSGPKSLAMAGGIADRVTLAVGADPARIRWGLEQVASGARAAGRDPQTVQVGAWINVAVGVDEAAAMDAIKGSVATFAHFSASKGMDFDSQPEILKRVTTQLVTDYDTRHHTEGAAPHVQHIDEDFTRWFAAIGTETQIVDRLTPLIKLGIQHFYLVGSGREALAKEIMPALRAAAAS